MAAAPMASPSGFSLAIPAARRACCLTSPRLGVASLARSVAPVTASLARVAVSLTFALTFSTLSLTASLAREGTSAL
jgi:hypothetical protein